ncbi:ABC transporter permease, partial [Saccharomonospora iraqiensis]|uniref:ABC transporter permease n=1 Tax=Saccharomonospora iraqiensis TaxID=52698 RepID=UPI00022DF542
RAVGGLEPGTVVLSADAAAALDTAPGTELALDRSRMTVRAVSGPASYSHTPVVWAPLGAVSTPAAGPAGGPGGPPGEGDPVGTVLLLRVSDGLDVAAADRELGTHTVAVSESLSAIGSFAAENSSLTVMRGFLFVLSALVVGAFFTVWTVQRSGDVAVLKALGASTPYLLRDALGQAVVLLTLGTTAGTGLAAALGAVVDDTVPFVLRPGTILPPASLLILLGTAGAALAVRRVTAVDPLTALGSVR